MCDEFIKLCTTVCPDDENVVNKAKPRERLFRVCVKTCLDSKSPMTKLAMLGADFVPIAATHVSVGNVCH